MMNINEFPVLRVFFRYDPVNSSRPSSFIRGKIAHAVKSGIGKGIDECGCEGDPVHKNTSPG